MSTYPYCRVNALSTTSSNDKWGLDPKTPPRATSVPSYAQPVAIVGATLYSTSAVIQPQLFTITLVISGQGSDDDTRYEDVENSLAEWAGRVGVIGTFPVYYYISATQERYAMMRAKSFDVERISLSVARVTIVLENPTGMWRASSDVTTSELTSFAVGTNLILGTTIADATYPQGNALIYDCIFRMRGPAGNPVLGGIGTNDRIRLVRSLTSSEYWYFNAGTLKSRVTTGNADWTSTTAGVSVDHSIQTQDSVLASSFRLGRQWLNSTPGNGRYGLSFISSDTTPTATTSIAVRYRSAWL